MHKAVWHDGRIVAVKVQYPGVAEAMASDLANIGLLTLRLVAVQSEGTARMTLVQQVALDNTP